MTGKHLARLGGDESGDGRPCRVFSIEKHPDGTFEIWEECDHYFSEKFTAEELRELAAEIVALSHSCTLEQAVINFAPVTDLWELDSLDHDQVLEGYLSAERGDPEPGPNRGKSYWHGWRCRMMDYGAIPIDDAHHKLVREWVERQSRAAPPQS